jgi:hypothetical protein
MDLVRKHAAAANAAAANMGTTDHQPPPRHLLDPAEIQQLLPEIVIVEFETTPFRVRYRLTGTQIDEINGLNLTNHYLDQFDDGRDRDALTPVLDAYRQAWQTGEAVIFDYYWNTLRGNVAKACGGIFPLTIDGVVRQAIAIEDYLISDTLDRPLPLRWR